MFLEFFNIIIFFIITLFLSVILLLINFILITQNEDFNKNSSYECGFQSFTENISNFNIQYYIIAIIFLIFDLEIMFLLPWISALSYVSYLSLFAIFYFFILLGISFVYEWKKGSLEWN